jgi:phosphatidylinositol dimannoside acyltransferase
MGGAALAVQTGAALMPVILWFEGDQWGAYVHDEIPMPAEPDGEASVRPSVRPEP